MPLMINPAIPYPFDSSVKRPTKLTGSAIGEANMIVSPPRTANGEPHPGR